LGADRLVKENDAMTQIPFKLLAIVAVDAARRVRCQQPHCGHGVYARIHVVEEAGRLLVLGSDCYAKRYGIASTANFSGYGGGSGRVLTEAESDMLSNNTEALLAQFELEREQARLRAEEEHAQAAAKLEAIRRMQVEQQRRFAAVVQHSEAAEFKRSRTSPVPLVQAVETPLSSWAALKKPNSSFFAYGGEEGTCWVLMQSGSHEGCFIVPVPVPFESWDEALPPSLGKPDMERKVYVSQMNINALTAWFSSRCKNGSRIDSDAVAIQQFAEKVASRSNH
jgi:hypothetical protein